MKARIPQLNNKQRKMAKQEIDRIYEETCKEKEDALIRRVLKTFIYVMHTEFGWGNVRVDRLIKAFTAKMEESGTDEVYWEHIDKVVVDEMQYDFKRDATERGRVVDYYKGGKTHD